MATIKDVAKLAKTSQGTVSNVFNNKGNVSSDKIQRVLEAAKKLNYIPNANAKNLRKGYADKMYLIIPNLNSAVYLDIYKSFSINAKLNNYETSLFITDNNPNKELEILEQLTPEINSGIKVALITTLPYGKKHKKLDISIVHNIIFILRDYIDSQIFISFDYSIAAASLTKQMIENDVKNVCICINLLTSSFENEALHFIKKSKDMKKLNSTIKKIDPFRPYQSILDFINSERYDALLLFDYEFSNILQDVTLNFSTHSNISIYSVTPLAMFPDESIIRYEMDYNILGKKAIELILAKETSETIKIYEGIGIRDWMPNFKIREKPLYLRLLSVDNPSADILRKLSIQYSRLTNIYITVDVVDYDVMHEILITGRAVHEYDIIRCDLNWMSWFAKDTFKPLDVYDASILKIQKDLFPEIRDYYMKDSENIYAFPFSPSAFILYYRKDIFERTDVRRQYYETFGEKLSVPNNFEEYDQIARFFTKKLNKNSPLEYGSTLTTGNSGVIGSELLARYYSYSKSIINSDKRLEIDKNALIKGLKSFRNALLTSDLQDSKWWTDTSKSFARGDTAMSLMYSNYAPNLMTLDSKIIGNIGQAIVPGENPLLGGGALGISKESEYYDEALDFIIWVSKETISSQSSFLGNLPCSNLTFEVQEIIDEYPWFETTKQSIALAKCPRTRLSEEFRFNEREFLDSIGLEELLSAETFEMYTLSEIADYIISNINLNIGNIMQNYE